jgi:hypothetical protein
VFWSAIVGWIMICAITLAIPDLADGRRPGLGHVLRHDGCDPAAGLKLALYFFILITQLAVRPCHRDLGKPDALRLLAR